MTLKDELPMLLGAQYAATEERRNSPRRNKEDEPSGNSQVWMCLVVKVNSDAVKNNIA